MVLKPRIDEDEQEGFGDPPDPVAAEPVAAAFSYRVAGNPEVANAKLEEERLRLKAVKADLERELYALRKLRRSQRTANGVSVAGYGALAGALVGHALQAITSDASALIAILSAVGLVLGAIAGGAWVPSKNVIPPNDNVPPAIGQ